VNAVWLATVVVFVMPAIEGDDEIVKDLLPDP
jgi:hypothetical protein